MLVIRKQEKSEEVFIV